MNGQHVFYRLLAALIITATGLTSCTEADLTQDLPDGKYPLHLTARVSGMVSRSAGKDSWWGNEEIAVTVDGATYKYRITDINGSVEFADDTKAPFYWQSSSQTATVMARYPYDGATAADISRQDEMPDLSGIDFMKADRLDDINYRTEIALTFRHRMAKVKYTLIAGEGVTDTSLENAAVSIYGYTTVTFSGDTPAGDNAGWITPTADGEALLVPQDMKGLRFIRVTIGSDSFYYTPGDGDADLGPGSLYTYNITVKRDGIDVAAVAGGKWSNGNTEEVTSKKISRLFSADDIKTGDYYYRNGTVGDGGLRILYEDGTCEFDKSVVAAEGCIARVFYVGRHPEDKSDYSTLSLPDGEVHGYAVALRDAADYVSWGPDTFLGLIPDDGGSDPEKDWNGYDNTLKIIEAAGGKSSLKTYPATYHTMELFVGAPVNSSDWFIPAIGQLLHIYNQRDLLGLGISSMGYYCSSSEIDERLPYYIYCIEGQYGGILPMKKSNRLLFVRPILVF